MTPERRAELMRYRDALLWKIRGDAGAAFRLAPKARGFNAALAAAMHIRPPAIDERGGADSNGEPLDPEHPWYGYTTWDQYWEFLKHDGRG